MTEKVSDVADVLVSGLRVWERNPRRIDPERFEALKRSVVADPEMLRARPLVALPDGRVIFGNMRLRAVQELGWETVPAVVADLDDDEVETWAIRDNVAYGEWDDLALADHVARLEANRVDLSLTGLAPDDLEALRQLAVQGPPADPVPGPEADDDVGGVSIGDPIARPVTGETWRLGHHWLVVVAVHEGWPVWRPLLAPGCLLVPYPSPTLPLTAKADLTPLVLVQPDEWMAGHLIDKWNAVRGGAERIDG